MSNNQPPVDPVPNESDIGNQNLERLLKEVYCPEAPDPDFVWSLKEMLCATARDLAQSSAQAVWSPITGNTATRALAIVHGTDGAVSPREQRLRRLRRSLGWTMTAAAAVAAVALFLHAWHHRPADPDEGDPRANVFADLSGIDFLTPRPRPPAPAVSAAGIGESLSTEAGRRRVQMPDGSRLFLNQHTRVAVASERHLIVNTGEVFIEVAPRSPDSDEATFTVQTPNREVTALGTKFAVRVDAAGTGVIVTQGKVRVSGLASLVHAGQQLAPGSERVAPLPRASHVLDWTRELMAAAESPLVPGSTYSGGALVAVDRSGQQTKLSLRKYHVDVHIEDGFSRTTIDQTYFNAHHARLEGTFYFPLPPDASLSRLAMYVDGNLMEGGMAERDMARNVYETIVTRQMDPALLEWVDGSTFKMRVFPLEGRQEKRIILSYTQRLPSSYGRAAYRFPAGHNLEAVRDWSFHARIKGGAGLSWHSDSHPLQATKDGADLVLDSAARQVMVDRDVTLMLQPEQTTEERVRFATAEHEGSCYLMVRYRPALPGKVERQRRDWVFLFESSSSRDPLLARVQIDVIRSLLAHAEHDDTFAILTAGTRVAVVAKPQAATVDNVEAALQALDKVHLVGALDLGQALVAAEPFVKAGQNPYLVHVGGGVATLGERREDVLARRLPEGARYVGVGVGKRWSRSFMKQAAERTGGYFTQINPDEPIAWRGFELAATLNTPRLLNVQVAGDNEQLSFHNTSASLTQGEELCAIARLDEAGRAGGVSPLLPKFVTIRGTLDGQSFEQVLPVQDVAGHADYLPRTWAKLEIDRLLAQDAQKNKPQIVALSKAMYVMTPFTSLLVLENEEMYKQFKVDRGRKDHWAMYPCPAKIPVVYEPEPAQGEAPMAKGAKPTAEEVVKTVLVRMPPRILTVPGRIRENHGRVLEALQYTAAYSLPLRNTPGPTDPSSGIRVNVETGTRSPRMNRPSAADDSPAFLPLYHDAEPENLFAAAEFTGWQRKQIDRFVGSYDGTPYIEVRGGSLGLPKPDKLMLANPGNASFERPGETGPPLVGGQRAMSIRVNQATGVAGFVMPNRHVDVYLTERLPNGEVRARPLLRNMMVLAVDTVTLPKEGETSRPNAATTTLAVTPAQALMLAEAAEKGTLSPGLRPPGGATTSDEEPAERNEIVDVWVARNDIPAGTEINEQHLAKKLYPRDLAPRTAIKNIDHLRGRTVHRLIVANQLITEADLLRPDAWDRRPWAWKLSSPAATHLQTALVHAAPVPGGSLYSIYGPYTISGAAGQSTLTNLSDEARSIQRTAQWMSRAQLSSLVYERPAVHSDERVFSDLVSYAPGMNTSRADVQAVREAEAGSDLLHAPGQIDPTARQLIDTARSTSWQALSVPSSRSRPGFSVVFDGSGRYRYERTLPEGLREVVVCDGKTLLHLYPELGIGARRVVSRFHRAEITHLVPWALPPATDLARGADLKCVDERTVAILPRGQIWHGGDDEPLLYSCIHLAFAGGRLAERRLVEMPAARVLWRETYDAAGSVKLLDADGKEVRLRSLVLSPTQAPELSPDTNNLVVLPLPYRTYDHVRRLYQIGDKRYEDLNADAGLALFAAEDNDHSARIFRMRFHARGVRPVGFYTLLAAMGHKLDAKDPCLEVLAEHPFEPLAQYLALHSHPLLWAHLLLAGNSAPERGLVAHLSEFRVLSRQWQSEAAAAGSATGRQLRVAAIRDFVRRYPASVLSAVLLCNVQDQIKNDPTALLVLAEAWRLLQTVPDFGYVGRYEEARCLLQGGRRQEARTRFADLYAQTLKEGVLPPIDSSFVQAMQSDGTDADLWSQRMRETAASLIAAKRRVPVVALAWQCARLGDEPLGDALVSAALERLSDDAERLPATLAAIEYYLQVNEFDRIDSLLQSLLGQSAAAENASLWRLAAMVTHQQGQDTRSALYLERALDIEYRHPPAVIDLQAVRNDYSAVLSHFQIEGLTLARRRLAPSRDFVARVIRTADRWRALDNNNTIACEFAAKILRSLGAPDLAWEYLTTPIDLRPNEANPWLDLAQTLNRESDFLLADRAYAAAFETEPTNPQILWDQAQNLRRAGKHAEARALYRQVAHGHWQPRFQALQAQARWQLESR